MRWLPWWRRRDTEEAQLLREAEAAVDDANRRTTELRHEVNLFAEQVEAAFAKRRPS